MGARAERGAGRARGVGVGRFAPGGDRGTAARGRRRGSHRVTRAARPRGRRRSPCSSTRRTGSSARSSCFATRANSTRAERQFASLAADLALLATQLCRDEARDGSSGSVLELAGDALAAASDERETGAHVARIAAMAAEADGALLWLLSPEGVVLDGPYARTPDLEAATAAAETIMLDQQSTAAHELPEGSLVVLRLGQPPIGVLQLLVSNRRRTGAARAGRELRSSCRPCPSCCGPRARAGRGARAEPGAPGGCR